MQAIVIGAGVVGASVAYGLARRGASVTLFEANRPASGTTRASFAWPNANDKLPRAYFDLNAAGLAEHYQIARELGHGALHPTGNLEVVKTPEAVAHQQAKVARLCDWNYKAEVVSEARARELVPDLAPPVNASYAFYPEEGWVAATVLTHRLLEAAQSAGARIAYPASVTSLLIEESHVAGVVVANEDVRADVVIDCSGTAAGKLLSPLGIELQRKRSPGLLVVTEPMPTCLNCVIHAPSLHLRPDGAGRVLCGSDAIDATLTGTGTYTANSEPCREILQRAQTILPTLAGARIEAVRLGWRPMPADGLSAVGPVKGVAGYYLVFTHSGITLGPILGKLAAEEIIDESPLALLAPFRPDRLLTHHAQTD